MVSTMAGWGIQEQQGWRKGPWTPEEDKLLTEYVNLNGEGRWSSVSRCAGLNRSGKSCRLRWVNYLRPGLKRGQITPQEEGIIIELHALWGNKWSTIARYLPGRTDNEIKNFWRTHFKKKEKSSRKQQKRRSQLLKEQKLQKAHHVHDHDYHQLPHVEAMNGSDQTTTNNDHQAPRETIKHENMVLTDPVLDQNTIAAGARDININGCHNNQSSSLPAVVYQDDTVSYSWSDTTADQDYYGLWGSLWNLDDQPYGRTNNNNNQATAGNYCYYGGDFINNHSNKSILPIQNQARGFSSYGGCIF